MSQLITIAGLSGVTIATTDDARIARDSLLKHAALVTIVTNPAGANSAALILRDIKAMTRSVEAARTAVKAPVLDQGRKIDALAEELTTKLEAEALRISKQLATWQSEQNRLAEEQRQRALEKEREIRREAERLEREAEARARAEQEARETEARRVQAELAAKAARARTEAGRERAAADAAAADERSRLEAIAAEQREAREQQERIAAQAAQLTTMQAAVMTAPAKQAGVTTRREVRYEVTNIEELYGAAPYLVLLSPNTMAIKAALKNMSEGQHLPGVKHWFESVSIVR